MRCISFYAVHKVHRPGGVALLILIPKGGNVGYPLVGQGPFWDRFLELLYIATYIGLNSHHIALHIRGRVLRDLPHQAR